MAMLGRGPEWDMAMLQGIRMKNDNMIKGQEGNAAML